MYPYKPYLVLLGLLLLLLSCNNDRIDNPTLQGNINVDGSKEKKYPDKFDISMLTTADKQLLKDFKERRKTIDQYIKHNKLNLCTCPGCGFPTLRERGEYEICEVCNWEDDNQDDATAHAVWLGPNKHSSLTEHRIFVERTLNQLSDSLGGTIANDPAQILSKLRNHEKRLNRFDHSQMLIAERDDSIWQEWEAERRKILVDLIVK